jgi:transglutaminase-like putative cysteine protease
MPIRVSLQHHTRYAYDQPVWLSPHLLRLKPAAHCPAPIEAYSLRVTPGNHSLYWQQDPFGNFLARVTFPEPVSEMSISVEMIAAIGVTNPFNFLLEDYAQEFPFVYDPQLKKDLTPFLEPSEKGPLLEQWLREADASQRGTIDFLVGLNQRVHQKIAYTIRLEAGVQSTEQTLELALGSCRDSAWLLVGILRSLGLAARFVSGYWVQLDTGELSPDGKPVEDSFALHAWAEVYLPGAGWLGLDPTAGLLAGGGHLPLACTREPSGAAPVTGRSGKSKTTFTYENLLNRIP